MLRRSKRSKNEVVAPEDGVSLSMIRYNNEPLNLQWAGTRGQAEKVRNIQREHNNEQKEDITS
jgi:hypothetical protein